MAGNWSRARWEAVSMVQMRVDGMPVCSGSWDGVNPENIVYVYSCKGGWISLEMVTGARQ